MTSQAERRVEMQARLADLTTRLQQIEAELETHSDRDWEEMAAAREADEVLEGMGVSGQQEIRMIQAALARMDAGEYGVCTKCGIEIAPERLDVLPFTPFCSKCAA